MKKSMLTKCFIALISIVFLLSCNSSRKREEVRNAVGFLNENCPIDYKGFGHFTHFECDDESKTIKIDFKLNNDYMKVFWLHEAFTEEVLVAAGMDVVKCSQTHAYIDWADKGYNVDLSICDDVPEEEVKSSLKWNHTYDKKFINGTKEDFDFHETLAQLITKYYVNYVLSSELPKETRGPWRINSISAEYDRIDIYYECTDARANDPNYFNIFLIDGEDGQQLLAGGDNFVITEASMTKAFYEGKMVWLGGEPLFALDFLYQCQVPARYHFDPICTVDFKK